MNTINGVDVPSQDTPTLPDINIEQPGRMIHRPRGNVIPCGIKVNTPHWLSVIFEGECAWGVHEVPYLYCRVTTRRDDVQSFRVELHRTDPVFVALTRHDQLRLTHCPYLP